MTWNQPAPEVLRARAGRVSKPSTTSAESFPRMPKLWIASASAPGRMPGAKMKTRSIAHISSGTERLSA